MSHTFRGPWAEDGGQGLGDTNFINILPPKLGR